MKKIVALLLLAVSIFALVSCSDSETASGDNYVITCGDTKLNYGVFYSNLYSYKNDFLFTYLGLTEDDPALWAQDSPSGNGETVGDTIKKMALEDAVQFAWVAEYAKDNGIVLTEEDIATAEENYNALKEQLPTEEEYQLYLDTIGFTDEQIREYYKEMLYYDKGYELLVGENGLYPVTDEDYYNYYEDNFYSVKHIFINDVSRTDEDGNTIELTEAEKQAQTEKANQIYADLEGGMDFDVLYLLSEDGISTEYPNGITFTDGMIDSVYESATKMLEVGEHIKVNGEYGGIYILLRVDLIEDDIETYASFITSALQSEVQARIYADHKGEVTVNYDLVNACKIEEVPVAGGGAVAK